LQHPSVEHTVDIVGLRRSNCRVCYNVDIFDLCETRSSEQGQLEDLRTDATKAAFFRCHHLVRQQLREMQDAWTIRKAEEIQGYADRNELKNFFKAIKAIYGPCIKGTAPLLSSDGTTVLTVKSQILKRWVEHFRMSLIAHQPSPMLPLTGSLKWTRTMT
uniref:Uncharacterized protein n=1 Tax=Schistocephalus solidus TaxID=70667 RepID=A0A183THJ2_SCHSO